MARAIWKGAISFGLIYVPVSLHSAVRPGTLDLDLLDKNDFSPVGYQRINKATGKPVDWKNIVKGYQYEKGEYVVLTDEDLRRANVEATGTIDIGSFVDGAAIAPYYFDTPYYLLPEKPATKVYALLREALARSEKLAIATIVLRTRQHVAALMPVGDQIMLNTLRYAPEILPTPKSQTSSRAASATGKELQMALKLVDQMTEEWEPERYRDTYRGDLMKRIEEKVASGNTRTLTKPQKRERPQGAGKVVDLMALLEKSLQESRGADSAARRRRGRAIRRSRARTQTRRRA